MIECDLYCFSDSLISDFVFSKVGTKLTTDILGKIIYSSENANQVQTSNWGSGVYFISLKDKNQTFKVLKIK